MTDKGLISKTYKVNILKKNSISKTELLDFKMDTSPEQTVFTKRCRDGQQTNEKMLHITSQQRVLNQNHNVILPHICENGYHQRTRIANVGKMWGKRNSCTLLQACQLAYALKNRVQSPQKPTNRNTTWPSNPIHVCTSEESKTSISKRYMHPHVTCSIFMMTKACKELCP